jgi:hypothetical protein
MRKVDGIELKDFTLGDKEIINYYLRSQRHELAVFAFENIYLWKRLYDIFWAVIEGELCVFFKDQLGSFLYLPPLNRRKNYKVLEKILHLLDALNPHAGIWRIETIEEKDISLYREFGLEVKYKSCDYLCQREELAELKGNKFKSQRSSCNHFTKNFEFTQAGFSLEDKEDCLWLYDIWKMERQAKVDDPLYTGMLEDSGRCLAVLLEDYPRLDCTGRVVRVGGTIRAFTFGYKLNEDTFCILYEVADLSCKGIAQFIFREFCRQQEGYQYVNLMDDSGLENLKQVKLSYHPVRLVPAYIASRKSG